MLPHMIGLVMAAQGAAQAAAAPAGPNPDVWPAPAGLILVHMTASEQSAHVIAGDSSGNTASATVTVPPIFVAGDQYDYTIIDGDSRDGDSAELNIGGAVVSFTAGDVISGTITVPTPAVQLLRLTIFGNADEENPYVVILSVHKH